MKVWEIFYKNVNENGFVKPGDKVLLAVSGGPDSVCMLHLFWRLAKKIDIELLTVNFDHQLRKESVKESIIIKKFSEKLAIPCIVEKLDVKKYAEENSVSTETAGRLLRYQMLESIAKKHTCNKIATAHNANDNAETVLMWLLRGSGSLAGIPQKRKINKKLEIIRPILPVKRKDIEKYVKKQKIPFCIDKSNFSDIYTRNRIRHSLIPIFEKLNPMAVDHIFSLSVIQAREDAYLEQISSNFAKKCSKVSKNSILLDLTIFLQYNEAIRYRILKIILPDKKYASHINIIMRKILSSDKSEFRLSSEWVFKLTASKAVFKRKKQ